MLPLLSLLSSPAPLVLPSLPLLSKGEQPPEFALAEQGELSGEMQPRVASTWSVVALESLNEEHSFMYSSPVGSMRDATACSRIASATSSGISVLLSAPDDGCGSLSSGGLLKEEAQVAAEAGASLSILLRRSSMTNFRFFSARGFKHRMKHRNACRCSLNPNK